MTEQTKKVPADEVRLDNGLVELWVTKKGRTVFVLPVWERVRHVVEGEPDHRTVMKMLWFDAIDHDWVMSDLEDRLDRNVGEVNLFGILEQHSAER